MYNIVIADDEATIRNGLAQLITSYQLDLKIAALACDGREALDAVRNLHPELLIIDINMPHLNGLEAIKEIRVFDDNLKVVILSGYDDFSYAQQALSYGVFAYLLKPIDFHNFRDVLQSAIDAYSHRAWELSHLRKETMLPTENTNLSASILEYLRIHHTDNAITLASTADEFHVSSSYVTKIIKQKTGMPFTDYLNQLRIASAKALLNNKKAHLTIGEIADAVGYSSQNYFCRVFKTETGQSPNQWRNQD